MTNSFLPDTWGESIRRLRVGIEPVDALASPPPLHGVDLHLEQVPRPHPVPEGTGAVEGSADGAGLPRLQRHRSGRFAILFGEDRPSPLDVRLVCADRRYVPRRLRIPVLTEAVAVTQESDHERPPFPAVTPRVRRPALFPGAAYGVQAGATAIRGRALHADGTPVRWTRAVARPDAANLPILGRAHGDDRGEFLLLLTSTDAQLGAPLSVDVSVRVTVTARPAPPVDTPVGSRDDPLWDLARELLGPPGGPDPVADGTVDPAGFTATVTRVLTCRRGRVTRPLTPFVFP